MIWCGLILSFEYNVNFTTALQIAQAPKAVAGGLALLVFSACGSGSAPGGGPEPVNDPGETIGLFMDAVKAEDLVTMGRLWGTRDGPLVRRIEPVEAQRRLRLMQIYLKHDSYTAVIDEGQAYANNDREMHYRVTVVRQACRPVIPFKLVRSRSGWLIENVNLAEAGNPARPCRTSQELSRRGLRSIR